MSLQGFKEHVQTDVPVTVNTVSRVDASLDLGQLTETVTVQSESHLLQTDKADTHTEIRSDAITQLPLQQNRNYQTLINDALRDHIQREREPLEETLRRVLREELGRSV